ncbi:MAG: hypothetical protein GWN62_19040, partial [Aliifodinibius sp.]|nr:hypothetical protein [Fodinibius sp.]
MKNNSYSQNLFKKLFGINLYVFLSVMLFAPCIFPQGSEEALSFDGFDGSAGEYIDIGNDPSLAITGDLTVELWFKIDAIPPSPGQTLVAFGAVDTPPGEQQENNTLYSISVNSSGQITAIHENGNGFDGANKSSATTISAGVWNYVAVVRDVAANNYKFYVNGKNEADNPHTYSGGDPNGGASSSGTIASFDTLSAVFFDGTIDEVRIWNVTRSLTEIRTNVCRKLTGAEGGLVAYYRMDGTSGTTVTDATGNGNTGTMVNMEPASDRVTSGAALGDDSNFLYTSNWTGQSVNLAHSDGDNLDVSNVAGSPPPDGVHIYRIDEPPNVTSASGNIVSLDLQRYWGVFAANGTSPTYDIVYDYTGHPGINNETTLDLARRADNSVTSWTETDAALDEANNTLTLTGESGTEYILGTESGENPLPITLTSFTARVRSGQVLLEWVTESEINNLGFEIWRSVDDTLHFELLTGYEDNPELRGAGNSNSKNYYNFADLSAKVGHQYYYTLWDVALSG